MKVRKKEQLVLSLIKNDLINVKLVHNLNEIGLCADDYLLNLSDVIIKLMGFKDSLNKEAVHDFYFGLTQKAKTASRKFFDQLAFEIYTELLLQKAIRTSSPA